MQNKLLILSMILLLFGGCEGVGDEWLGKSVAAFASQRDDLNEAKELIKTLAAQKAYLGFWSARCTTTLKIGCDTSARLQIPLSQ